MMHPLSIEAWKKVSQDLPRRQRQVFNVIARSGAAMTCDAVANVLGVGSNVIDARFRELEEKGYLIDTGLFGVTRTGSKATLWEVHNDKLIEKVKVARLLDWDQQVPLFV